jgi:fructose-1,6-bisphosphatase I
MIAEQAGGSATTGKMRIMDISPANVHQRVPFAIGSICEIQKYEEAYAD